MKVVIFSLVAGAVIFFALGAWSGLLTFPWEHKTGTGTTTTLPGPTPDLGPDLWVPEKFPPLDPGAGKPRTDPITLRAHMNIDRKQDVPSNVAGQVLFIGVPVPDVVVGIAGAAAFMAEPFDYNTVTVGDTKIYKFYRRLLPGQIVYKEEIVAMIECSKALNALREKQIKIELSINEEKSNKASADEAEHRYMRDKDLFERRALSAAELHASEAAKRKYHFDWRSKEDAIRYAEHDLVQAKSFYTQHEIRNKVGARRSVIQYIYRVRGDAVKEQETLMVLNSLERLQAEALIDASQLDRIDASQLKRIKREMTATIEPTHEVRGKVFHVAHRGEVSAVAVTNDAKEPRIVSAGSDKVVSVRNLDLDGSRPERPGANDGWPISLRHDAPVRAMVCTPPKAEQNLCVAAAGDKITIWDVDRKALGDGHDVKPVKVIAAAHPASSGGQAHPVTCLAFSPDGVYFASGAEDGSIALWKTADGARVYPFDSEHGVEQGHTDPITSLSFTPQCLLVSAARDNTVRVWRLKEKGAVLAGEPIAGRGGTVAQLGVRSDGKWLVFDQGRTLQLVSLERPEVTITIQNPGMANPFETLALFSPDGSLMLTAGLVEGRLQLWKAPTETARGFEVRQFVPEVKLPTTCAAFAPQHAFAVSGNSQGDLYLWTLPTPQEVKDHRIEKASLRLLAYSLDSTTHQARIAVDVENPVSRQYPNGRLMPGKGVTVVIEE